MTTQVINGTTYTVKYVDPGATGANDGSTVTDALTALPATASLATLTMYIVRRTVTELNWTVGTCSVDNVIVMGCPKSTDMLADLVPSAVMSAWGADSPSQAIFLISSATAGCIFSGNNHMFSRLEIRSPTGAGTNSAGTLQMTGATPGGLRDCIIKVKGADITDGTRSTLNRVGLAIGGIGVYLVNCEIHGSANIPVDFLISSKTLVGARLTGTTFKWWDNASGAFSVGGGSFLTYDLVVDSCVFYKKNSSATSYALNFFGDKAIFRNTDFKQDDTPVNSVGTTFNAGLGHIFQNCRFLFQMATSATFTIVGSAPSAQFIGCTFSALVASGTPSSGDNVVFNTGCTDLQVKDSTFAIDGWHAFVIASANANVLLWDNNTITKGGIWASRKMKIPTVDISLSQMASSNFLFSVNKQGQLYIQTLTCPSGGYVQMNNQAGLFIDSCNNVLGLDFGGSEATTFYCLNEAGVTGNWHAESLHNKITASSTYRTGSSVTFCYKAEGKTGSVTNVPKLYIAPRPYQGIPVSFGSTGRKTITVYIAYKNYTPTLDDLDIQVEVPDGGSGSKTKVYTAKGRGYIDTDSSTWVGDSGLTTKKVVIVIDNLDRAESVYVRIGYNKYAASAYTLIDPTVVGA